MSRISITQILCKGAIFATGVTMLTSSLHNHSLFALANIAPNEGECISGDLNQAGICAHTKMNDPMQDEVMTLTAQFNPQSVAGKYGEEQEIPPHKHENEGVISSLMETYLYMETDDIFKNNGSGKELYVNCRNTHQSCTFWASVGECANNPAYMLTNCAPACRSCDQLDINNRCKYTPEEYPDALRPGDLDRLFYDVVNGKWDQYGPVIHSAPKDYKRTNSSSTVDDSNVKIGGPWVVTFDNFLTDEEADRMIELGYEEGFDRSTDVGQRKFDGTYDKKVSTGRTSNNAWCMHECEKDPIAERVGHRIGNVTTVPSSYSENFQILRYEETQRYNRHHDYISHHDQLPSGVRILTFFLYLNDVEEGGETRFNDLKMDVKPKKGKALLWPSVLNVNPNSMEPRTHHEARPVIKGHKYAANLWIHNREFRKAHAIGCSG